MKHLITYNESIRDKMTPKSDDEINDIVKRWTPRERFLKSFRIYKTTIPNSDLYSNARELMIPFEDIKVGDYLTISTYPGERELPLSKVKEKITFNNDKEYLEWKQKNPNVTVADDELNYIYKNNPNQKVDAVITNIVNDYIFRYGHHIGVFPYNDDEIKKYKSKFKDRTKDLEDEENDELNFMGESIRDKMTPKSYDEIDSIKNEMDKIYSNQQKAKYLILKYLQSIGFDFEYDVESIKEDGYKPQFNSMIGKIFITDFIKEHKKSLPKFNRLSMSEQDLLWNQNMKRNIIPNIKKILKEFDFILIPDEIKYGNGDMMIEFNTPQDDKFSYSKKYPKIVLDSINKKTNESVRNQMTPKSEEEVKNAIKDVLIDNPARIFKEYTYDELLKIVSDKEIYDAARKCALVLGGRLKGWDRVDAWDNLHEIIYYLYKNNYIYDNMDSTGSLWFKHTTLSAYSGGHYSVNGFSKLKDAVDYVERMKKLNESVRYKMTPKKSDDIRKDLYEYFEEYKYLGDGSGEINKSGFLDSFNTYIIIDWEDYYREVESYMFNITKNQPKWDFTISDEYHFTCYPEQKVMYCDDGSNTSWYFDGELLDNIIDYMIKNEIK